MMLEHDILFLMEAYNQPYDAVMAMPSSRRHRIVKSKEEITRQQKSGSSGGTNATPTGLDPTPKQAGKPSLGLGYGQ